VGAGLAGLGGHVRYRADFVCSNPRCGLSGWRCRWSERDPKAT
jgi:hypothetical protein